MAQGTQNVDSGSSCSRSRPRRGRRFRGRLARPWLCCREARWHWWPGQAWPALVAGVCRGGHAWFRWLAGGGRPWLCWPAGD